MSLRSVLILIALIFSLSANAERKSLADPKGNTSVDLPAGWQAVANLYGLPWVILGPDHTVKNGSLTEDNQARRSTIAVIPTGQEKVAIDPSSAEKSQAALFASRKQDIEKDGGSVLETIPYSHATWKGAVSGKDVDVHHVGLKFRLGTKTFAENSYHVVCDQKLFMLKSMVAAEDAPKDGPIIEKIARSFRCE